MTRFHNFTVPFLILDYKSSVFDDGLSVTWVQNARGSVKDVS